MHFAVQNNPQPDPTVCLLPLGRKILLCRYSVLSKSVGCCLKSVGWSVRGIPRGMDPKIERRGHLTPLSVTTTLPQLLNIHSDRLGGFNTYSSCTAEPLEVLDFQHPQPHLCHANLHPSTLLITPRFCSGPVPQFQILFPSHAHF